MVVDEMKIHEDFVFDKHGQNLLGFVSLGVVNEQLQQLERRAENAQLHESIATHMLTVMVRGIFIKLEFPYASFPTQGKYNALWNGASRTCMHEYHRAYKQRLFDCL